MIMSVLYIFIFVDAFESWRILRNDILSVLNFDMNMFPIGRPFSTWFSREHFCTYRKEKIKIEKPEGFESSYNFWYVSLKFSISFPKNIFSFRFFHFSILILFYRNFCRWNHSNGYKSIHSYKWNHIYMERCTQNK